MADDDFVDMASGKLNGQRVGHPFLHFDNLISSQQAFMSGKLKLKGNMMLAQKLGSLFQEQANL
jgi:3-hydroxyacyl-CoA dehydrogenase/3a,7a,12a-trihydroxy-5b-cholest-24-enoyl-CoA hydratase